jgi:anti-sigma-K factor RskA
VTCAEYRELVGAYVLGALDGDERAAVEAHLAQPGAHEGCAAALADARRAFDALGAALAPLAPEPGTWAAIEAQIGKAPAPGASAPAAVPPPRPSARRFVARALPWVLLAAAVLAILWTRSELERERGGRERALVVSRAIEHDRDEQKVAAAIATAARVRCAAELDAVSAQLALQQQAVAMLQLPATRVVAFAAKIDTGGGGATAIVNMEQKRAMILAHGMPRPAGKDFELWVIRGDEKIAAGLMRASDSGELLVEIDPKLLAQGADALAVTLEPEGGGATPRGDLVLVAAMPKT